TGPGSGAFGVFLAVGSSQRKFSSFAQIAPPASFAFLICASDSGVSTFGACACGVCAEAICARQPNAMTNTVARFTRHLRTNYIQEGLDDFKNPLGYDSALSCSQDHAGSFAATAWQSQREQ